MRIESIAGEKMDVGHAVYRGDDGKYYLATTKDEWQNLDRIIDALERAGCCRDGYVHAPEDVVANAIRDWLRSLAEQQAP